MELVVTILVLVATLVLGWIAHRRFVEHTFLHRYGIAGPKPHLFFGNILQLKKDRVNVMTRWIKQYGKHFGYYIGGQAVIVCSDIDTLRQVLIKESTNFIDRPEGPVTGEPFKSSIIYLKGEEWKRVRGALTPSFSSAKLRLMSHIMQDCISVFVDIIKEKAQSGTTFNMDNVAQGLTLDVICKCALAMDTNCQRAEGGLRTNLKEFLDKAESDVVNLAYAFPFLRLFFKILYYIFATGGLIKLILLNLEHVIRRRRSGEDSKQPDILQIMLDSQTTSGGKQMTDYHIMANAFIYLVAGFETSATSLSFITQILVEKPEVQQQILDEVTRLFPDKVSKGEKLTYEDVQELKHLDHVFNECMRIYPPVILFISRHCLRTCTLNGYTFPGGAQVLVPVYQLHRDPELWDAPDEFRPQRFSPDAERPILLEQFMPFGLGPRMCIGMRFATLQIKMALVELLRNVRLKPGEGFQSPPELIVPSVIINSKNGVRVCAELI
ncbi:cytochrome P450 3A11-like [Tropilaelaps mercedesae]|uniref:Thromboxane-A synthase n=1 Tax=Tropilaelaps mercedesae TaxID=418985 RepID=A0A1V9XVP0_9ACAR|nr:cytochrome P450 3A11-like [Tropilaelaps mercedesae]